jgi:hypothetical protein
MTAGEREIPARAAIAPIEENACRRKSLLALDFGVSPG